MNGDDREAAIDEAAQDVARFVGYLKEAVKDEESFVRVITVMTSALAFQTTLHADDLQWPQLLREGRDLARRFGQHPDAGLGPGEMKAIEDFADHFESLGSAMLRRRRRLRQAMRRLENS